MSFYPRRGSIHSTNLQVQAALVICDLFICNFAYVRLRNGLFPGTYPQMYSYPWSF